MHYSLIGKNGSPLFRHWFVIYRCPLRQVWLVLYITIMHYNLYIILWICRRFKICLKI